MPGEGGEMIETLPAAKENRKINFREDILVTEIEDRFFMYGDEIEQEEEEAYEIEIVEDDGDADFYLEIVDGEVFYVFETEDDMSEGSMEELLSGDEASVASSFEASMHSGTSDLGFDLDDLEAPMLDDSEGLGDSGQLPQGSNLTGEIKLDNTVEKGNASGFELEFETEDAPSTKIDISESTKIYMDKQMAKKEERQRAKKLTPDPSENSSAKSSASVSSKSSASSSSSSTTTAFKQQDQPPIPGESVKAQPMASNVVDSTPVSPTISSLPGSPKATAASSVGTGVSPSSKGKSILKASGPSPRKIDKKKVENKKEPTDKKTRKPSYTKTYVRAEQFDGEHRVYSAQKPEWAQERLAPTPAGETVRQGGNLANPITHIPRPSDEDQSSSVKGGEVDKEEILRRFVAGEIGSGFMYGKTHKKLKLSVNGAKLREGGDIVKPITKATVIRTPNDINHLANPGVLRSTPKTDKKPIKWEKPEWTQTRLLKPTSQGAAIKGGADLETKITPRVIADAEITTAPTRRLRHAYSADNDLEVMAQRSGQPSWATRDNGRRRVSDDSTDRLNNGSGRPEVDRAELERRQRQERLARVAKDWKESWG